MTAAFQSAAKGLVSHLTDALQQHLVSAHFHNHLGSSAATGSSTSSITSFACCLIIITITTYTATQA